MTKLTGSDDLTRQCQESDALLRQALDALLPHKSTVLRWYTPVDAAIDAIKQHLGEV
jgi:hypothetical protein